MQSRFSRRPRPTKYVGKCTATHRVKAVFDDCDEHVGSNSAPDLRAHRVLAVAQEFLDSQMLLDPFEEQLHLPSILVERGDQVRGQDHVVGQKRQGLTRFWVFEAHAAKHLGVVTRALVAIECNALIAHHAGSLIDGSGIDASGVGIGCPEKTPGTDAPQMVNAIDASSASKCGSWLIVHVVPASTAFAM